MEQQRANAAVTEHYKGVLLHTVQELFDEYDIGKITELIYQLSYYSLNPAEAKSLCAEKQATMQHDAVGLVNEIVKIYAAQNSYIATDINK